MNFQNGIKQKIQEYFHATITGIQKLETNKKLDMEKEFDLAIIDEQALSRLQFH